MEFSIVVAVFNAERYLGDTLTSVLRQRFRGAYEIIVVDDGSTDGSASIAERFRASRPEIFTVLRQANRGPSAARNAGLALARGTFVNFLDADDCLDRNALRRVRRFFARQGDHIDIVTIPIERFDARRGPHPLNFKFSEGPRVIDLLEEPDAILRHTTASFIRRRALPARPFDGDVRYGEDALAVLRLLLENPRYGVVSGTRLLKRSRRDQSSLVDRLYDAPEHLEEIVRWHAAIVEECTARFGMVPPFVQSSLLYDYQWQAKSARFAYAFRDAARRAAYLASVRMILAFINPDRIRDARHISAAMRILLSELKDGAGGMSAAALAEGGWALPDVEVCLIRVGERVEIEGRAFVLASGRLSATVNGSLIEMLPNESFDHSLFFFGTQVRRFAGFFLTIPPGKTRLEFAWTDGDHLLKLRVEYGPHCGLAVHAAGHHAIVAGCCVTGESGGLRIEPASVTRRTWRQAKYLGRLLLRLRLRQAALRLLAHCVRARPHRPRSYILLDRVDAAGDNGELLFRHVGEHGWLGGHNRVFFCVARSSPDYLRMKETGGVLGYGTLAHLIEFFRGAVVISSHANAATFNPFGRDERFLRDMIHIKRVFVPHGVMNSSHCHWCSRDTVNLDLFTTTTRDEYAMMLASRIGYTAEHLRWTGMPRYDRLQPGHGNTIVLMPTWRQGLLDRLGSLKDFGENAAAFEASDFASEWRAIAESSQVARLARSGDIKVTVVWHPQIHRAFRRWSRGNGRMVEALLGRETVDFEQLKNTGMLLVTDYSSISFDFAYLGKPIAYYQFDAERMLADPTYHRYPPDFDFRNKGFGPILKKREHVLGWIHEKARDGAKLDEPYRTRADRFFEFRDRENCRRVWSAISSAFPPAD